MSTIVTNRQVIVSPPRRSSPGLVFVIAHGAHGAHPAGQSPIDSPTHSGGAAGKPAPRVSGEVVR